MTFKKPLRKLIIIPAYNEENNLDAVVQDILDHAPDFDFIIIDDCSTDNTRQLCERRKYPCIHLPRNLGIGGAVQTGYLFAQRHGYDIAVQFDGDGQHQAKFLTPMLQVLTEGKADMVLGSRYLKAEGFQSSQMRQLGIRFLSDLIFLIHRRRLKDVTSGMRMTNRAIIDEFCAYYPSDYPEPETLAQCLRRGYQIIEYPVTMRERLAGKSSITPIRSVYYMVKVSLAILIDTLKPTFIR